MSNNKILTPEEVEQLIDPEWRDAPDGTEFPPREWDDEDADWDR